MSMSLWDENPPPLAGGDSLPQRRPVAELHRDNGHSDGERRNYAAAAPPGPPVGKTPPRRKSHGFGGKQITRTRVSYSCHTCRRRKVKCDKVSLLPLKHTFYHLSIENSGLSWWITTTGPSGLWELR